VSDLTERLAAKLDGWTLAMMYGNRDRDVLWLHNVTEWLPLLLSEPELVAGLPEATKAALLRTLLGEPDLLWPDDNAECGMPSVSEAADWCEMDAGDVKAFDVAKTLGKRWIAMLPTDLERDDGYADGIGWLDGEAVLFDSLEEADQAMFARKASLLAPEAR